MITVRYFAKLRDITGREEDQLSQSLRTVSELIAWAERTYEDFGNHTSSTLIAVNEEYAGPHTELKAGDVVAFIPPVSGG